MAEAEAENGNKVSTGKALMATLVATGGLVAIAYVLEMLTGS